MTALHESLRKQLEKTVVRARDVAEEGAGAALDRLGVGAAKAYKGLTDAEQELRRRLRARGRQLGDVRRTTDEQETRRLTGELAYEYWHRMLFARFLAENDLLMHPEAGVSVSLADCEELATEEGLPNGWLLAERWAARMLPEIFRPADPLLQVPFAPEHERALELLLEALPAETFRASDALGWVYQFWQAKRKDEVNKSGVKIGADELPAVTQLFTEPYMVHFLLDNTLGAWWTGRHPGEEPPVAFEYLRLLDDGTPAAGTFDGWPKRAAELKVLDPCCGSGHFLVAAFLKLVPMRMREEGLTAREACDAVLRDNLHGLEIDPRCTQIAAFAVALAAWAFPGADGHRALPSLNVACSGNSASAGLEEWLHLAGQDVALRAGLARLYALFEQAPILGSLINPHEGGQADAFSSSLQDVQPLLRQALCSETATGDTETEAVGVVAAGLASAARLLAGRYSLVVTNVPYLTRGKHSETLRTFLDEHHEFAKQDLATAFIQRCVQYATSEGSVAVVAPQAWWFLSSYRRFRQQMLTELTWKIAVTLGEEAWQTFGIRGPKAVLCVMTTSRPPRTAICFALDALAVATIGAKQRLLTTGTMTRLRQSDQLRNPDARITVEARANEDPLTVVTQTGLARDLELRQTTAGVLLGAVARSFEGLSTGDLNRYVALFWGSSLL